MAHLHKLGEYEGPGEQRTVEYLASNLPDKWHVVSGRKLPVRREDIDIIVVAENQVFVIEEKHWGPVIVIGDQTWKVVLTNGKHDERENPLSAAAAKARKVAGWLRGEITHLPKRFRVTEGLVIVSYPKVDLRTYKGNLPNEVMDLEESIDLLLAADLLPSGQSSQLAPYREDVLKVLLDAESGPEEVRQIENYSIRSEVSSEPGVRTFEAEHIHSGDVVWLKAYDNLHWQKLGKDPSKFVTHQIEVLRLDEVADSGRVWTYAPPIEYERRNWFVLPMNKPRGSVSIATLLGDNTRDFYKAQARNIVREAFAALADLHQAGVVHRAIHPERVWICKGLRVKFNDLSISHVDGLESIGPLRGQEAPNPYADDDAQRGLAFSTKESDVYALAFVLAEWLSGLPIDEKDQIVSFLLERSSEQPYAALLDALNDDPAAGQRPTAASVAIQLAPVNKVEAEIDPQPAKNISSDVAETWGGFQIESELGQGAVGKTYRVSDDGQTCLLKVAVSPELFPYLEREATIATQLAGVQGVMKVLAKSKAPSPGFLLLEFAEGDTLGKFATRADFSVAKARVLAKNTLSILAAVHDRGYLHGDLSPKNIIINEDLEATIIDFGLGRKLGENLDSPGAPLITPPEVVQKGLYTVASDIYGFAVSLSWAILNRPPYVGDETRPGGRDYSVVEMSAAEIAQWGQEDSEFIAALLKACDPNPDLRPQSANEFIELLHRTVPKNVSDLPDKRERKTNPFAQQVRGLYVQSKAGTPNALGLASQFALDTYIPTKLDTELMPAILQKKIRVAFLTGNPGDGKTAFLQMVERGLCADGGQRQDLAIGDAESGWEITRQGHRFLAVYDASEGYKETSADSIVSYALQESLKENVTALLAINDGRLHQFFDEHEEQFEEYSESIRNFFATGTTGNAQFVVVDLKGRSVVDSSDRGLASDMIDSVTNSANWDICNSCVFETVCPINKNRQQLAGPAKKAVLEMLRVSHLRRLKRRTLRQIRSTMGWLISGDLGCEDIAEVASANRSEEYSLDRLIFDKRTTDQLIHEWSELDPGEIVSPEASAIVRQSFSKDGWTSSRDPYVDFLRKEYLGIQESENHLDIDLQKYRYLDLYSKALDGSGQQIFKEKLLLGISRLVGLPGHDGSGLAFQVTSAASVWGVVAVLPEEEFDIKVQNYDDRFIESVPDGVELIHSRGRLKIHLDLAELILRSSDGMLVSSTQHPREINEINAFIASLRQTPAQEIFLVEPSGARSKVSSADGVITLRGNEF